MMVKIISMDTLKRNGYKLEFIFMKHYAPNRCLYKKTEGGGGAELKVLYNFKKGGVGVRWVVCDPIEGIIQLKQKIVGGRGWGQGL